MVDKLTSAEMSYIELGENVMDFVRQTLESKGVSAKEQNSTTFNIYRMFHESHSKVNDCRKHKERIATLEAAIAEALAPYEGKMAGLPAWVSVLREAVEK